MKFLYNQNVKLPVVVHPSSKNPRVEKDLLDMLHVYVKEPPLEGRANKAVVEALSGYFHIKKADVVLLSGAKSKKKTFLINLK